MSLAKFHRDTTGPNRGTVVGELISKVLPYSSMSKVLPTIWAFAFQFHRLQLHLDMNALKTTLNAAQC